MASSDIDKMSPAERRAGASLAAIFALRMLGLFLILPVFAVHAHGMPGGDNVALVGMAIGAYGLTQAFLQIPFGAASDRFGRKPVIVFGLLLFIIGSAVAAMAADVQTVVIGRVLQGAGAISAAVTALAADLTRDQHRTKVMAMIGSSIGLVFALSLVAAPLLYAAIGIPREELTHVFQKFYRVDNRDTREIGGTGLGLYLAKQRVEAMNGRIWAESELGKGTRFIAMFPRLSSEAYEQQKFLIDNQAEQDRNKI